MITNKINADLVLKEPEGGIRFGTDALLLADFAKDSIKYGKCIDLGTGSGVLPLLLLGSGCNADFVGLELQKEYAEIAKENAKENGFESRFSVINGNAEDYKTLFECGRTEYVITNPPYMRSDCGFNNESKALDIARREISGGAELFCRAAAWCLKSGGSFFAVYRPDRLVNLICAMRSCGIEPKRLRAVVPSVGKKPSLILIEGKKDGKEGLIYENDLIIYKDKDHKEQTEELKSIYNRF
ncbi:MAG: methyltransferase domain-containing protein [Ruminococcaceae bacterium]|nr:methyltransferase domain-containing protein [Oscillospiraceae bacterium]